LDYYKHKLKIPVNITKIVTIHYFEFSQNYKYAGESHNFWEMVYADKGNIVVQAGNTRLLLKQGEAFFHKPNEFHTLESDGVTAPNIFIVTFVSNSKAMSVFKGAKIKIPIKLRKNISLILDEGRAAFSFPMEDCVIRERENADFGGEQLIKIYLEHLLIMLIRDKTKTNEKELILPSYSEIDDSTVAKIMSILEDNIYGRITVNEICAILGYSRPYISRLFRETCNVTVGRHYINLKISETKMLIREGQLNFSEIAEKLCFSDSQYFSTAFKRETGMTPREYAKSVV
jgi:AraC-like DNA-binding protein/quercetin dioxygenase-like cupin family protein